MSAKKVKNAGWIKWGQVNGTRAEFNAYFQNLPTMKRKVCWIGLNCDHCLTNIASQDYDQRARALVVYALTNFRPILMVFLASG